MTYPKIGFIGLGLMGASMVERLQDVGYPVTVLGNRSRTRIDAAIARGATEATDAKSLTEASDIVMLCVTTSEQVEARMRGDDGVLAGLRPGQIVIDFGTSLPASTITLGDEVAEKGATYLDGPLGRTPEMALLGRLNIMCSGDEAAFETIKPVLDHLGENVFHLGALGTGHKIKLINNYYGMTVACAMAEAFAMADIAGVPRESLSSVMSAGPSHSMMMDFIKSYALENDLTMEFSIANSAKDLGYYSAMAENLGAKSWIAPGTANLLSEARDSGFGERMVPEVLQYLTERMKPAE